MSGASYEIVGATRQTMECAVALECNVRIRFDRLEYVGDHVAVHVAVLVALERRLAHLDPRRVERHVAVLRRRHQQNVFEVFERFKTKTKM